MLIRYFSSNDMITGSIENLTFLFSLVWFDKKRTTTTLLDITRKTIINFKKQETIGFSFLKVLSSCKLSSWSRSIFLKLRSRWNWILFVLIWFTFRDCDSLEVLFWWCKEKIFVIWEVRGVSLKSSLFCSDSDIFSSCHFKALSTLRWIFCVRPHTIILNLQVFVACFPTL